MTKVLIAINGKIGSGKDTLMGMLKKILFEKEIKIAVGSLAAPIRNLIITLTGHTDFSQNGKLIFLSQYNCTVGELMQKIGEGLRKEAHEDLWIEGLLHNARAQPRSVVLITQDLRYKNEAEALKQAGAILIRLNGDPAHVNLMSTRNKIHKSEIDLDDYKSFDFVYHNTVENGLEGLQHFAEVVIDSIKERLEQL